MSKLSRSVLKEIVKECIVEVFEESFFPNKMATMNSFSNQAMNEKLQESKRQKRPQAQSSQRSRSSHLDNISFGNQTSQASEKFNNKVEQVTKTLTSDPVMASIFKDTAATTLQEQYSASNSKTPSSAISGDAAARAVGAASPEDLFGQAAGKWAQLAFADPINKLT
jgi:hypothetical protein